MKQVNEKIIIIGIFFILSIVFFVLAICYAKDTLSGIWINLTAGSLTVVLTVMGVDYLREKNEKAKWTDANNAAKDDLEVLSNMLITYMSVHLGISVTKYNIDRSNYKESISKILNIIIGDLLQRKLEDDLFAMSTSGWKEFELSLIFIRQSLVDNIKIYNGTIPPVILGKLLIVRKSFNNLYNIYILFPDLLTKSEDMWPINKNGLEYNRQLRSDSIVQIKDCIYKYFIAVKDFREEISRWEK